MADNVDIDALVMQARATARELNELLASLEKAGVEVSVASPPSPEQQLYRSTHSRVSLGLRFTPEDEHNYLKAGNAGLATQAMPNPPSVSGGPLKKVFAPLGY